MSARKLNKSARSYASEGVVGETPLIRLNRVPYNVTKSEIWVKCEWCNPTGSVKDRAAYWMIRDAEDAGLLAQGKILLDSTSGNTGIALAQFGAARRHRVTLCIPENASPVRQRLLKLFGAELIMTSPLEGDDGARAMARKLVAESPEKYLYLDQYSNPMNWQAHYEGTAEEIWRQTSGAVTHFVASLGTSGTFVGTSRRLKELNSAIQGICVQPNMAYHGIEGMKDYTSTAVPPIFDSRLVNQQIDVETEAAFKMSRRLAREEGLPTGTSGGAAVVAALEAAQSTDGGVFVVILPDNVMKTIGGREWEDHE